MHAARGGAGGGAAPAPPPSQGHHAHGPAVLTEGRRGTRAHSAQPVPRADSGWAPALFSCYLNGCHVPLLAQLVQNKVALETLGQKVSLEEST